MIKRSLNKKSKLLEALDSPLDNQILCQSIKNVQNDINIYGNDKVIALCSPREKNICAYFSKSLSLVYAKNNEKTLLIDCDLYSCTLTNIFAETNKNIAEFLGKKVEDKFVFENLVNKIDDNLDFIGCLNYEYPSKLLSSDSFKQFIIDLSNNYDHIILNIPPIAVHQDVLLIKDLLTAFVLVTKCDKTNRKDIFESMKVIKQFELPYIGSAFLK